MPKLSLETQSTSAAWFLGESINVLAHQVINETPGRYDRFCDIETYSEHLLFTEYGEISLRFAMAKFIVNLSMIEESKFESMSPDELQEKIDDLKAIYKASIRRDSSQYFVPRFMADDSKFAFTTEGDYFHKHHLLQKDGTVDRMLMMKLNPLHLKLMVWLNFAKAMSILGDHMERIFENADAQVDGDDQTLKLFENFVSNNESFKGRPDVKASLLSITKCKTLSDLQDIKKTKIFENYNNFANLKDQVDTTIQTWEAVVLPLTHWKSMAVYTIPEARVHFAESEIAVDDGEVDFGLDDQENVESQQAETQLMHAGSPDFHGVNNEDDDDNVHETILQTQPTLDDREAAAQELDNTETQEEIPVQEQESTLQHSEFDKELDSQLETQPRFDQQDDANFDSSSFDTAQESHSLRGESNEEENVPTAAAIATLEQKRMTLARNVNDPLESMVRIASTANSGRNKVSVGVEDDIESVNSQDLMKRQVDEKSTQRTKPGRKRTFTYNISDQSGEDDDSGAGQKSRTRLDFTEQSEGDDLFADDAKPVAQSKRSKRTRREWTEGEENAVIAGYRLFSTEANKWSKIKSKYSVELKDRNNINIKDFVRTLRRKGKL